jgi:hypothetical protein
MTPLPEVTSAEIDVVSKSFSAGEELLAGIPFYVARRDDELLAYMLHNAVFDGDTPTLWLGSFSVGSLAHGRTGEYKMLLGQKFAGLGHGKPIEHDLWTLKLGTAADRDADPGSSTGAGRISFYVLRARGTRSQQWAEPDEEE